MIKLNFYFCESKISGFEISGHSTVNEDDFNGKLICSAVSSAAIMTANTVTDVIGDKAEVNCSDGYLKLVCDKIDSCQAVLNGFYIHMISLSEQYPQQIQISKN